MSDSRASLAKFNSVVKQNNEIYRGVAKAVGLSESAFWILYMLRDGSGPVTQGEICAVLSLPKQTINSALKKLEAEGYLTLRATGDLRKKYVSLTDSGLALAARTVDRVMEVEAAAMAALTQEEQAALIDLTARFTERLSLTLSDFKAKCALGKEPL